MADTSRAYRTTKPHWPEDALPGETLVEFGDRTDPEGMARARADLHKDADNCDCGDWRGCPNTDRPRRRRVQEAPEWTI